MRTPPALAPELVPDYFAWDEGLYRRLADGSCKAVVSLNGNKLTCMFDGERLNADDISWCLHHGNWPHYSLVQVDGNPFNTHIDNLFPTRTKTIRFRQLDRGGLYYHPLVEVGFPSPEACRADWNRHAADFYRKDLAYVLRQEAEARELRIAAALPKPKRPSELAKIKARERKGVPMLPAESKKPGRPAAVPGRVWHWYKKDWLSVPEPVHVSDDYMIRCEAVLNSGATLFKFQPEYGETWAYRPDGTVVERNS